MAAYKIQNLVKRYGGRTVLDLKELALEKGLIHGLLGPNGAGKTTLLEIMAFLLSPSSGTVWFNEGEIDYRSTSLKELRKRVVLVQQKPIMFSTTVSNNVEFPLKLRKRPSDQRRRIVDDLLRLVGMEEFREKKANTLSGGETQRVAIAQALACSPEVILLDEPTASVDVENQIIIERIIREINREKGISVVMTTHDMVQASRVADEIIFMFEGQLAGSIYENIFSGNIEIIENGIKYCVIQNGFRFAISSGEPGPLRLSINPENIKIKHAENRDPTKDLIRGRLIQLTEEKNRVRVLVDVGVPLSVLVSKDYFNGLSIGMGEELLLHIPEDSIKIF